MDNSEITYLGFLAAFLTTASTLPQAISIIKTKNVEGISISMFFLLFLGINLWLVYGILRNDIVIVIANTVTSILIFINIFFIIKYKKKEILN